VKRVTRIAQALVLALSQGCSGLKIDSGCSYVREVKLTYQCAPGGHLEHLRTMPLDQQ
jgi:hypothetical protein